MIPRYSRPEMAAIWTDEAKYRRWLDVEVAACEAWAELGVIPARRRRKSGGMRASTSRRSTSTSPSRITT
ncbi:hypothetical protein O0235_00965 [Tepidiforma flava]|uniref:Adenylosuccinate lyase n=1 Tax=Tepidiforma flava TaxID=3004094 RepID=A0ABY7M6Q8_9CHLR|nr:hypothetical protein [Tepidiforma flava]WBL36217.1 hypothetical protein O0235_00965 [Tepidiforma flava]